MTTQAAVAGGTITHTAAPGYLDDGPEKPVRIWTVVSIKNDWLTVF